jgi:hypothetical protein
VLTSTDQDYDYLITRFCEDSARHLVDVLGQWHSNYVLAVYVETGLGKSGHCREQAASDAQRYGWRFGELKRDPELVRKLLAAEWDDGFLSSIPASTSPSRTTVGASKPCEALDLHRRSGSTPQFLE